MNYLFLMTLFILAACQSSPPADADVPHSAFPLAARPIATIVSPRWSSEAQRDKLHEARDVIAAAGVHKGMTVADIGAGEGYYTVRLSGVVGKTGRVLAQDVEPAYRDMLAERVSRERLDNVSVKLGTASDPGLPAHSFDRIFMIHMYHEIATPLEFLWRMRPALVTGGEVVVVDEDRPTAEHGTPPALLACEFAALGFARIEQRAMAGGSYLARFKAAAARPAPPDIHPCGTPKS